MNPRLQNRRMSSTVAVVFCFEVMKVLLSFILLRYYSTARAGSRGKNLKRAKKDSPHLSWNDHFLYTLPISRYNIAAPSILHYLGVEGYAKRNCHKFAQLLFGVQVFFSLISPITGALFTVTADGYERGPLLLGTQVIPLAGYLLFFTLVFSKRSSLRPREIVFLLLYVIIPLSTCVIFLCLQMTIPTAATDPSPSRINLPSIQPREQLLTMRIASSLPISTRM